LALRVLAAPTGADPPWGGPAPVWAEAQRPIDSAAIAVIQGRLGGVDLAIQRELSALCQTL